MAYTVTQRTREIGIRMALGAASGDVARMILRDVTVLVGTGLAIALPAAWALGRYVENQLFGIAPTDPATVAAAVAALVTVAALAGVIPARRAARINPIRAAVRLVATSGANQRLAGPRYAPHGLRRDQSGG